jgi:hypothetical protein
MRPAPGSRTRPCRSARKDQRRSGWAADRRRGSRFGTPCCLVLTEQGKVAIMLGELHQWASLARNDLPMPLPPNAKQLAMASNIGTKLLSLPRSSDRLRARFPARGFGFPRARFPRDRAAKTCEHAVRHPRIIPTGAIVSLDPTKPNTWPLAIATQAERPAWQPVALSG